MKRVLFCLVLLLVAEISFAQYFELKPNGFMSKDQKDYIVVEVAGAKQKELYTNVLNAINTLYTNPQNGLNVLDGESISLSASKRRAFKASAGIMNYDYDADYTLSFLFKDGKIRVNSPKLQAGFRNYNGTWNEMNFSRVYFKNNGEIKSEKNYSQVNNFINQLIKDILDKSGKVSNW